VVDLCPRTPLGERIDPRRGCSLAQLCPCAGPPGLGLSWRSHGRYVSCLTEAANDFRALALISSRERSGVVAEAARSSCGP
jgi:hypothetical protein